VLELSQVILGVRDLDAATRRMEALGLTVLDGGVHPGVGTANRVVPLRSPVPRAARRGGRGRGPGGLVRPRAAGGDRRGRPLGPLVAPHRSHRGGGGPARPHPEGRQRVRPDGVRLTWKAAGIAPAAEPAGCPSSCSGMIPRSTRGSAGPTRQRRHWCRLDRGGRAGPGSARALDGRSRRTAPCGPGRAGLQRVALATESGELVIG